MRGGSATWIELAIAGFAADARKGGVALEISILTLKRTLPDRLGETISMPGIAGQGGKGTIAALRCFEKKRFTRSELSSGAGTAIFSGSR